MSVVYDMSPYGEPSAYSSLEKITTIYKLSTTNFVST